MNAQKIATKLKESGFRGLMGAALRRTADYLEVSAGAGASAAGEDHHLRHQRSAHRALSRYTSFEGKQILEVGGAQSGDSALPFLEDGAAGATVTGLEHITQAVAKTEFNLKIQRADALALSDAVGTACFDVVYGLSIVEHIPSPTVFLDEVYKVLKPGGLAYFEGDPIWSSAKGHHVWVATWGGPYAHRATANYLFSEFPGHPSTNPLPDWSHILMTPDEMRAHLLNSAVPDVDIECILDWVYRYDALNRIHMTDIAAAYTSSRLIVLEANTSRVSVPQHLQAALRKRGGDGIDYGISGVTYILKKP